VSAAVGIAMMFLVKKQSSAKSNCQIQYIHPCDIRATRIEKFDWLKNNSIGNIHFDTIHPDRNNNWINLSDDNDWDELIPLIDKKKTNTVFNEFSNGINTARDEWVYDFDIKALKKKVEYFKSVFNSSQDSNLEIKWSRDLKLKLKRKLKVEDYKIEYVIANYRPFVKMNFSLNEIMVDVISLNKSFFIDKNFSICCNVNGKDLRYIASNIYPDWHFIGDTKCLPLYHYDKEGNRIENITGWGLQQFVDHYQDNTIRKEEIFHYTYAVLHNPAYRKKYELNLKRDFPRLPFYEDFRKWAAWGKALMDLHINYETVNPWPLERHDFDVKAEAKRQKEMFSVAQETEEMYTRQPKVKVKLKADKTAGIIEIDELTFLRTIPKEAWEYKLGNRSAIEWVLDQYKEKKPKDSTIAEKFNTYKFADYKEQVIDLLERVCTVSVETVKIVRQMEAGDSSD
jgi:predicted helicase